jgi:membrane-bound ClpP family serine protease
MRIGASLVLIAIGAVLKFAVTTHVSGVSLGAIGVILMIVGAAGLLITAALLGSRRRTDVIYRRDGVSYVEPADQADRYYV